LVGKAKRKRTLWRSGRRWEDITKDFEGIGWEVDLLRLAWDRHY